MLQLNAILNLGADAEVKTINEKQYISFRGASTEKVNGQDQVTWVSCLAGNNPNLLPFLKKGQQVFVSGKMKASIYQSQNNIGMDISIFAQTLQLCGGKKEEGGQVNIMTGDHAKAVYQEAPQPQQTVIYPDRGQSPMPPAQDDDPDSGLPF